MRIQRVNSTKGHMKLSPAALDCLAQLDGSQTHILGDVSHDGTYGWLARGGFLEMFWTSTGQRLAAWCFGSLLKEPTTVITAICECCFDKGSKLIVATSTVNSEGLICLFDTKNCTVMKAIEVPYEVTSLDIVSTAAPGNTQHAVLGEQLKQLYGVLAVGTQGGHVYLVDLCLDDDVDGCDELSPNTLQHVDPSPKDLVTKRYNAMARGKHLCLELGEEFHVRGYFNYTKPDNTLLKSFSADQISVSCLKFVSQTGILAVGLSFGCFMLWKLQDNVLEYSSRFDDNLAPVTHIAFQEPENDPRNFCYIWVAKGPLPSQSIDDHTSVATLYQLCYNKKTWYDGHGYLFEELTTVGHSFETALTSDPFNLSPNRDEGSRIISCYTLRDTNCDVFARKSDDSFEGGSPPEVSLCVIVWEAAVSDPHAKPPCYIAIFDMNRWYHAQMPAELRLYGSSLDVCPYFAICSLTGVQEDIGSDDIMAVYVPRKSLARFQSGIVPAPEQFYFPSSLSFDAACVTESGVVHAKYLGIQKQILADLQSKGPYCVSEAHEEYNLCMHAGLLPRTLETSSALPLAFKREALLNMALDYNLTGFINSCVVHWASGELNAIGCTLRFLLEWCWKKVAFIKETVDQLCVSLFDWSGVPLDQQSLSVLYHSHRSLQSLGSVISTIAGQSTASTEQGRLELQSKQKVVSLITERVSLVLWFCQVGLLPEHSEEEMDKELFVYPLRSLTDFYTRRRSDIKKLHCDIKPADVLMIDALTAHIGEPLANLWQRDGHPGLYPPASLYVLLNMSLLENIKQKDKHILIFYLLCDLLDSAPEQEIPQFNDKIRKFTQAYNIPLGVSKLVQGLWLLDHKDYEDSMLYLLDPTVQNEICTWQHTKILKALLYQGKEKLALQYLKMCQPPLPTSEGIKLKLTILLANKRIAEAFEYQRVSRDKVNVQDLLSHVFLGCQQTKAVDQLLLLPFCDQEEQQLVKYLKSSQDVQSQELLVLYYLLRARYVEAFRLNNSLKQHTMGDLDHRSRERTRVRNSLVEGYYKVLPSIQRKLCFGDDRPSQKVGQRKEYERPTPLSMTVNKVCHTQAMTRASLYQSVVDKVREVEEEAQDTTSDKYRNESSPMRVEPPEPFIGTPYTPKVSRDIRLSEVVFPQTLTSDNLAPHGKSPLGISSPFRPRPSTGSSMIGDYTKSNSTLKRKQQIFSAEALSLLRTPTLKQKTPSRMRHLRPSSPPTAPHSILKVRQKLQKDSRSPSPPVAKFQLNDLTLPTPPRIQRSSVADSQTAEERPSKMVTTSMEDDISTVPLSQVEQSNTSKHLRFVGVSPDTTPDVTSTVELAAGDAHYTLLTARKSIRDATSTSETPIYKSEVSEEVEMDSVCQSTTEAAGFTDHQELCQVQQQGDRSETEALEPDDEDEDDDDDDRMVTDDEVTFRTTTMMPQEEAETPPLITTITDTNSSMKISVEKPSTEDLEVQSPLFLLDSDSDADMNESYVDEGLVITEETEPEPPTEASAAEEDEEEGEEEGDISDLVVVQDEDDIRSSLLPCAETTGISDSSGHLNSSHEEVVEKNVHEEGHTERQIREYKLDEDKITQVIETTTTKTIHTETIKVIDLSLEAHDSSHVTATAAGPITVAQIIEVDTVSHPEQSTEPSSTDHSITEDDKTVTRHQDPGETDTNVILSTSEPETSIKQPRRSVTQSATRRNRKTSEHLALTPTRRSTRKKPTKDLKQEVRESPVQSILPEEPNQTAATICHAHQVSSPSVRKSPRIHSPNRKCTVCQAQGTGQHSPLKPSPSKSDTDSIISSAMSVDSEGPMTRIKTRRSTTPSRTTPSRSSSRTSFTTDETSFNFSKPLAFEDLRDTVIPSSPVPPFIFSPPITRSQRRESLRSQKSEAASTSSVLPMSALPQSKSNVLPQSPAKRTRSSKKKEKVQSTASIQEGPSDSPINFVSPVKEEELIKGVITRQRVKAFGPKVQQLRPQQGTAKKRKPLNW